MAVVRRERHHTHCVVGVRRRRGGSHGLPPAERIAAAGEGNDDRNGKKDYIAKIPHDGGEEERQEK